MSRRLVFTLTGLLACPALLACERSEGHVEINWTIVDRLGGQVFPSGALTDTCAFVGRLSDTADAPDIRYALQLRLRLCEPECTAGCDDPACQVDILPFDCASARGFTGVQARSEAPYNFVAELVASPDDGACGCVVNPPCALVPGSRRRTVEPGLVTDLQVYLLVLGVDDIDIVAANLEDRRARLDLATCCTPDPTCAAP